MSNFAYTAVDSRGKTFHGFYDEKTKTQVMRRIKEMGLFPMEVQEVVKKAIPLSPRIWPKAAKEKTKRGITFGTGIGNGDLVVFTRELATLVEAGVSLMRGLQAIERQEKNRHLARIEGQLIASIEGGSMFSEALAKHPKVFNRLFINMIVAGETSGMLDQALTRLADLLERTERLKGKVIAAMFYPSAPPFQLAECAPLGTQGRCG